MGGPGRASASWQLWRERGRAGDEKRGKFKNGAGLPRSVRARPAANFFPLILMAAAAAVALALCFLAAPTAFVVCLVEEEKEETALRSSLSLSLSLSVVRE